MRKLTPEEAAQMGSNHFGFFQNTEMYKALVQLEEGEGFLISHHEWPLRPSNLNSSYLNLVFTRLGWTRKFRVRSVQTGKEAMIVRLK